MKNIKDIRTFEVETTKTGKTYTPFTVNWAGIWIPGWKRWEDGGFSCPSHKSEAKGSKNGYKNTVYPTKSVYEELDKHFVS